MENEMLPVLYFEVASVSDAARVLNDLVGNLYKDHLGNVFRITGFYHFQVVVDHYENKRKGGTISVYEVIALPIYEHLDWLSATQGKTMAEVLRDEVESLAEPTFTVEG